MEHLYSVGSENTYHVIDIYSQNSTILRVLSEMNFWHLMYFINLRDAMKKIVYN